MKENDFLYIIAEYGVCVAKCIIKAVMPEHVVLQNENQDCAVFHIDDERFLSYNNIRYFYNTDIQQLKEPVIKSLHDLLHLYKTQLIAYQNQLIKYEKILDEVNKDNFEQITIKKFN